MRAFLFAILFALSIPAHAGEDWHFTAGEELAHGLSVCLDLADAKAMLNTDRDAGNEAAQKLWTSLTRCRNLNVAGPKVGKVVYSVETKRDGKPLTLRVVEILDEEGKRVIAYFITAREVKAAGRPI